MGCAAVRGAPKNKTTAGDDIDKTAVSEHPVGDTWATKINPISTTPTAGSSTTPTSSGQKSPQKQDPNLVMQDADDDDEIEIIYEAAPKVKQEPQMRAAANGQEASEVDDLRRQQQKAEAEKIKKQEEPLSVAQQQEAAKLAERRKKFDNDRFLREQAASGMPGAVTPMSQAPQQQSPSKVNSKTPTSDMGNLMGLNQGASTKESNQFCDPNPCFPGGVFDESDFVQPVQMAPTSKKKIHTHDDVDSKGFDADDERMMTEILQDFDDV